MSNYFKPLRITLLLAVTVFSGAALAQEHQNGLQIDVQSIGNADVHVLHVRDDIYMLTTSSGNITASIGREGILLVDPGPVQNADKVLAVLKQFKAPKPIRFILNTNADPNRAGADEKMAKSGVTYNGEGATEDADMVAFQGVLDRLSAEKDPAATLGVWDGYLTSSQKLYTHFNGEGIELFHIPNAHTDADSLVYFRQADVIVAGDIFSTNSYPVIDMAKGGSIQGIVDGLIKITDLAELDFLEEGGTLIIPGNGRVCDAADVAYIRDMTIIIRDRVQTMIKQGKTLEQVKAAGLTKEYDTRYNSPTWTKDMFLDAVYKSLKGQK